MVIIAPHGGSLTPTSLRDRACSGCILGADLNTQELARAIALAFELRTGTRPHLVVNRLHRRKLDANRDLAEATDNNPLLEPAWRWMHAAIDSARVDIGRAGGRGLVVDVHGHAHAVPRIELGYQISASQLRLTDAALDASGIVSSSSIARLARDARSGASASMLLRGPNSIGTQLAARGYPAVPSSFDPAPLVGEEYFDGGYNTGRHGSASGGLLDAVQVECNYAGVRDSPGAREAFAEALAASLVELLTRQYGWSPGVAASELRHGARHAR